MPEAKPSPGRIDPQELLQEFERVRSITNEFERNIELSQLSHSKAKQHDIDAETIQRLYAQHCRESSIPALAKPLFNVSRRLWTTQEALKNVALISVIASSISFFAGQNEARTLFIQKQWELAESGPKIGPVRQSAIETLAAKGFNLGKLQAHNLFLAGLKLPRRASLQGASFNSSNLYGASLIKANLYYADFSKLLNGPHTNLENANLSESDLREARFKGAYMKKTCLRGANLEKASFGHAVLSGADFRGAKNLKPDQLRDAINARQALYDPDIAVAIGAQTPPSRSGAEPASCRLPAKPSNLFTWFLSALQGIYRSGEEAGPGAFATG